MLLVLPQHPAVPLASPRAGSCGGRRLPIHDPAVSRWKVTTVRQRRDQLQLALACEFAHLRVARES